MAVIMTQINLAYFIILQLTKGEIGFLITLMCVCVCGGGGGVNATSLLRFGKIPVGILSIGIYT